MLKLHNAAQDFIVGAFGPLTGSSSPLGCGLTVVLAI